MENLDTLRTELKETMDQIQILSEKPGPEAMKDMSKLLDKAETIQSDISTLERRDAFVAQMAKPAGPPVVRESPTGAPSAYQKRKLSLGEVCAALANPFKTREILNAQTGFAAESIGPDGGFLLQPEQVQYIDSAIRQTSQVISNLTIRPQSSDLLKVPYDETPPWAQDFGTPVGVAAGRVAEGGSVSTTKPPLNIVELPLNKLISRVDVTDELLRDLAYMGSFVADKMAQAIAWRMEKWFLAGTGVGQPKGLLKGPGLVTQAKETSNATLVPANVFKMMADMLPGSYSRAFWLCHPLVLPQLFGLISGSGGWPLFVKDVTAATPYGTLMGRPIVTSEVCAAPNAVLAFNLVDPAGYFAGQHVDGIQTSTNIWLYWEQGLQAMKATVRVSGAPALSQQMTRADGTNKIGHTVTLAAWS
jgi:HK97 family phage major capsid protein